MLMSRVAVVALILGLTATSCGSSTAKQRPSTPAPAPLTAKHVVAGFMRAGIALSNLAGQPLYSGTSMYMERYAAFVLITRSDDAAAAVISDRSQLRSMETDLVQGAATQT